LCQVRNVGNKLCKLGFEGPKSGTRHQFMIYQQCRLTVPSNSEYSVPQLKMMIREVEAIIYRQIDVDEWNRL